jgi:hypothetical protein
MGRWSGARFFEELGDAVDAPLFRPIIGIVFIISCPQFGFPLFGWCILAIANMHTIDNITKHELTI